MKKTWVVPLAARLRARYSAPVIGSGEVMDVSPGFRGRSLGKVGHSLKPAAARAEREAGKVRDCRGSAQAGAPVSDDGGLLVDRTPASRGPGRGSRSGDNRG